LHCSGNKLTNLNLSDCVNLEWLRCSRNQISDLSFLNSLKSPEKLTFLSIRFNNSAGNLIPLWRFINLENLSLGSNFFIGSLEPLKNLSKLKKLSIHDTDIDSGLEYLPESIESFHYLVGKRKVKVKTIYDLFANEKGEVETENESGRIKNFPQKLQEYKQKIQEQQAQTLQREPTLKT